MALKLLLLILVLKACFLGKAIGFSFELVKTTGWQYPGRCLDFTLKSTLNASTPLSLKALAPHVSDVPHMIILESKFTKSSGCTSYTGSYKPVLTARSSNAALKDELTIDLGTVTVSGTCVMHFDIKFQMISHTSFSNGATIWPGFAVEYQGGAVFAVQHAVKTVASAVTQPSLKVALQPAQTVFDSSVPMVVNVKVVHDCLRTTAKAVTAEVSVIPPPGFQYSKITTKTGSVAVTKKADNVYEAGVIELYQFMDFDIEYTMTSSVKQGRELETGTFFADVTATGSGPCAIDGKNTPSTDSLTASSKVYKKFSTCDAAPGSGADDIVYQSFSASSYSAQGTPDQAKFGSPGAWKPSESSKNDRRQFLQVSFTTLVKLRRLSIQGMCDSIGNDTDRYVTSFKVYYSTNGALWSAVMEGSNVKILQANKNCESTAIVPLPYDIEAKFVRINTVDFENAIAAKVEFYGCKSTTAVKDPLMTIPNRSIMGYLDNIIVCNTGMARKTGESSCHISSDGKLWKGLYYRLRHVAFFDPVSGKLYGLGGPHGNVAFRSAVNAEDLWELVSPAEFTATKALSGTVMAKTADSVVITDDQSSLLPLTENKLPANTASITWGFSGQGVHSSTDGGTSWTLRATWSCKDLKK